jgi:virulence-associated protein VapD
MTHLLSNGIRSSAYMGKDITAQQVSKILKEVNVCDFNFKLIDWKSKGDSIIFELLINSEQDSKLRLYGKYYDEITRIFDDFGNEYYASKIQLGNIQGNQRIENTLVAGVPMRAIISFDNLSSRLKNIALLEIRAYDFHEKFKIEFRDILVIE